MDKSNVGPLEMDAAKRFCDALIALGFEPNLLAWAHDEVVGHNVLVMVTEYFDAMGPLTISKALFKARNADLFDLDPFTLRLHSTGQPFGDELASVAAGPWVLTKVRGDGPDTIPADAWLGGGLRLSKADIVHIRKPAKASSSELHRRWSAFMSNLDKAAA